MKITKDVKLLLQFNSFVGMAASVVLLKLHMHETMAWFGLIGNGFFLVYWIFVEAEDDPK